MSLTERGLKRIRGTAGRHYWRGVGLGKATPRLVISDPSDPSDLKIPVPHARNILVNNPESRVISVTSVTNCPDCGGSDFRASGAGKPLCVKCWGAA